MKLPLIVRDQHGQIYHVLQFDGGWAMSVNPRTLKIEQLRPSSLIALSETEYTEWKKQQDEVPP